MAGWNRAPWSLRAFVVVALAGSALVAAIESDPIPSVLVSAAVTAGVCFFLLKGIRWLWIVAIGFGVVRIAAGIFGGGEGLYGVALGVVGLGLLLLPDTRRFFQSEDGWIETALKGVAGVLAGVLGFAALVALFLVLNLLVFHMPLSTR